MPNIMDALRARGVGVGVPLEGDAIAGDLRAGKKAMNADGPITGTLPVRAAAATQVTPGTADQVQAAGIYDGPITVLGDPDLITPNIKAGANLFGVPGKAEVVDTTTGLSATAAQILAGREGFSNGAKVVGNMPNQGAVIVTPSAIDQLIALGFHDGTGKVIGDPDLIAANILSGKNIFGVIGNVAARLYASGSATSSSTTLPFTGTTGPPNANLYYVTVGGLTFQPTMIYVWHPDGYYSIWTPGIAFTGTSPTDILDTAGAHNLTSTGNGYVNATGFQLPFGASGANSKPVSWKAFA